MVSPQARSYQNPVSARAVWWQPRVHGSSLVVPHRSSWAFVHGTAQGGTEEAGWAASCRISTWQGCSWTLFPAQYLIGLSSVLYWYGYHLLVPGVIYLLRVCCAYLHYFHKKHSKQTKPQLQQFRTKAHLIQYSVWVWTHIVVQIHKCSEYFWASDNCSSGSPLTTGSFCAPKTSQSLLCPLKPTWKF